MQSEKKVKPIAAEQALPAEGFRIPAKEIGETFGSARQRHAAHDHDDDEHEQKGHEHLGDLLDAAADLIGDDPTGQKEKERLKAQRFDGIGHKAAEERTELVLVGYKSSANGRID